jgi:hypothetical protein
MIRFFDENPLLAAVLVGVDPLPPVDIFSRFSVVIFAPNNAKSIYLGGAFLLALANDSLLRREPVPGGCSRRGRPTTVS